jgi:aminoglycoside 2'-N-acetyltransferase I
MARPHEAHRPTASTPHEATSHKAAMAPSVADGSWTVKDLIHRRPSVDTVWNAHRHNVVMTHVTVTHTADLDQATLAAARALLYEVFDDMESDDWEHSLGGMHAVAWDGPDLIGHAALIQRRLLHAGRALRAGYVEGVAVRADRRRRGLGAAMMAELERVARSAYDVAALGATDQAVPFYTGRGWLAWRGPTSALTPTGVVRTTEDDGAVFVLPLAAVLDLDGEITCDWRDGDVW